METNAYSIEVIRRTITENLRDMRWRWTNKPKLPRPGCTLYGLHRDEDFIAMLDEIVEFISTLVDEVSEDSFERGQNSVLENL